MGHVLPLEYHIFRLDGKVELSVFLMNPPLDCPLEIVVYSDEGFIAFARKLGYKTVYDWARRGKIPAIKLSRSKRGDWRFDLQQIEKWERLRTTGAMD
jgi:hypothetical protein